jgi:hypothetical protein
MKTLDTRKMEKIEIQTPTAGCGTAGQMGIDKPPC